ncbi:MAG: hypothetical protein ABWY36_08900 [Leifsonia sp.]
MSSRGTRVARGLTAATLATLLAACSHTIAGGSAPIGVGSIIAFAFAALVCIALAGRTLSLWRLSLAVVLSQLAFHGLFAVTGSAFAFGHTAHGMHELAPAMPSVSGVHSDAGMLGAHLVAALLTIAALRAGERAALAVFDVLLSVVRVLIAAAIGVVPIAEPRVAAAGVIRSPRDLGVVLSSMRYRGPPVGSALA